MSKKTSLDKLREKKKKRAKAGRSNDWSSKVDLVCKVLLVTAYCEAREGMDPTFSRARWLLEAVNSERGHGNSLVKRIFNELTLDDLERMVYWKDRQANKAKRF
jgi:hypothetical protein